MSLAFLMSLAKEVLEGCDTLATFSESPDNLTRLFLSPPMHDVHETFRSWMEAAGMQVRVDDIGNIIGHYPGQIEDAKTLLISSHLDTVKNAGKYDGMLGVLVGIAAVKSLRGERLPFAIDVIGFSEEEGVRFGKPFFGSNAVIAKFESEWLELTDTNGITLRKAIQTFGLNPDGISAAAYKQENVLGYLEVHIEQGPKLADLHQPLGIVSALVGATRASVTFTGKAGHAGTTPMELRRDALAGAAQFVLETERHAKSIAGLVATIGQISAQPGAINVIPGEVTLSLDVRHGEDVVRHKAVEYLKKKAAEIASSRHLQFSWKDLLDQPAVPMDTGFRRLLKHVTNAPELVSGAGHDAMVLAPFTPSAMLFVRSPNGISHHPDETVLEVDVTAALGAVVNFLRELSKDF
jgi:allantoate deiminase